MRVREWEGAAVDPADEGPPDPGSGAWRPVQVPGRPERFAGEERVAYRARFEDPRADDERALLTLSGCYAHARLWLNDEFLGAHDAYFAPARFPLDDVAEENVLVVECRAPEDRFGGVHDSPLVPDHDAVPGIWWGADVESVPETYVRSLSVAPRHAEDAIDVSIAVDAGAAIDERATVSLRPEGFRGGAMMERARVAADAGERTVVEHRIDLRDPAYWWPADLGPQHRYAVRVELAGHERTATTGLCRVVRDEDGFRVNGRRLPIRGVNLLDCDDPVADVERAAEANANLVRAHAHVPPHDLHAACDEAGVLVWQDLPLYGPGGYDVDRGRELARALARAYGRHPSIATYGIHDDPRDPFAEGLGSGLFDRWRTRWRAWRTSYDPGADESVASALPDDRPALPVCGPPGVGADALHLYPGWDYGDADDVDWLLDRYASDGIVGEFGAGAFAREPVDDAAGFDREKHDRRVHEADPVASQAHQAEVLRTVADRLRSRGVDAAVACALRDTDAAGFGVLDRGGERKRGYEALASSFEPVRAIPERYPSAGESIPIEVVNDTHAEVSGTIEWTAGADGDATSITVGPLERAAAGTVSLSRDAAELVLELSLSDRRIENRYPL